MRVREDREPANDLAVSAPECIAFRDPKRVEFERDVALLHRTGQNSHYASEVCA